MKKFLSAIISVAILSTYLSTQVSALYEKNMDIAYDIQDRVMNNEPNMQIGQTWEDSEKKITLDEYKYSSENEYLTNTEHNNKEDIISPELMSIRASGNCGNGSFVGSEYLFGDNVTWVLDGDGTLTIAGEGEIAGFSNDSIYPWYYYKNDIKKIVIKYGVTNIPFQCFRYCSSLENISIADSVTEIGSYVFEACSNLKSIYIPSSVTSISYSPFYKCTSLVNIEVDKNNTNYCNDDYGVLYNKNKTTLIQFPSGYVGDYIIPNGVTEIATHAFSCIDFVNLTIPYTVLKFKGGFSDCSDNFTIRGYSGSLIEEYANSQNITFESIGIMPIETIASGVCGDNLTWTFDTYGQLTISGTGDMYNYDKYDAPWKDYFGNIKAVDVEEGVTSIGDYAFYCSNNVEEITSLSFPHSLRRIGTRAFTYMCDIKEIEFPEGLAEIGEEAFRLCGIQKLNFPDSMREIGEYAFYLNNLVDIDLGNGVENIGAFAFSSNYNEEYKLESVTIPASVKNMDGAFCWCYDLKTINLDEENGNFKMVDGIVYTKDGKKLVFCPSALEKNGVVNVLEGTEVIGERAFDACSKITAIIIPEGVKEIGGGFASDCDSLKAIYVPSSLTTIAYDTFFSSLGYRNIEIPDIYYGGTKQQWESLPITSFPLIYGDSTVFHWRATGTAAPVIRNAYCNVSASLSTKIVEVGLSDTEYDSTMITVFYKDGVMVDLQETAICSGDVDKIIPVTDTEADTAKIFIWSDISSMKPLCDTQSINLDI